MRATLHVPALRWDARAEAGRRRWLIERVGSRMRPGYALLDEAGRRELARLRRDRRRSTFVLAGREAEWRRLGRKEGYGAVAEDGRTLVRARVHSGWRANGTVAVDDSLRGDDALAAAVLAALLALRKLQEQGAAATAVV